MPANTVLLLAVPMKPGLSEFYPTTCKTPTAYSNICWNYIDMSITVFWLVLIQSTLLLPSLFLFRKSDNKHCNYFWRMLLCGLHDKGIDSMPEFMRLRFIKHKNLCRELCNLQLVISQNRLRPKRL